MIWGATFGVVNSCQFDSLIAWTRPFITYKDVVGKYYQSSGIEIQEDIAMAHKSGLVKL